MTARASGPGCSLEVRIDGQSIWRGSVDDQAQIISHEMEDADDRHHLLEIELLDKKLEHTQIDEQGNILSDLLVTVSDFKFDGIEIDQIVYTQATYNHDFNGTKDPVKDEFYGTMGCNGTVSMFFTTPVYLWLLENM